MNAASVGREVKPKLRVVTVAVMVTTVPHISAIVFLKPIVPLTIIDRFKTPFTNRTNFLSRPNHQAGFARRALYRMEFDSFDFVRVQMATHTALFQSGLQCIVCLRLICGRTECPYQKLFSRED